MQAIDNREAGPEAGLNPPGVPPRGKLLPRQLSEAEFSVLTAAGRRREAEDGQVIFQRGELGRSMFVIESGQVRLEFGDGMPDKLIGPREYFGELALFIGNHGRVANAFAAGPAVLRVIEADAFERLLDTQPALLARFMLRSFSYLVASEQQLIQSLKRRNEDLMVTLDSLQRTRSELGATRQLVLSDELTGLANRRGLYHRLEQQPEPDGGLRYGLLLIDVDRFKHINDHHGHLTGDRVLQAVAEELRSAAGADDLACRLGGDEFALLARVVDAGDLANRAVQLVGAVRGLRFPEAGEALRVGVSVGGCLAPGQSPWSAWYSLADTALYQVKAQGGDGWRLV
jgi:diguanylate cyclase